jgi:hypothetical protein
MQIEPVQLNAMASAGSQGKPTALAFTLDPERKAELVVAFTVRSIDDCDITIRDIPETGHKGLSQLPQRNIRLIAITAVRYGPTRTQPTVLLDDTGRIQRAAQHSIIPPDGPHPALLVQGDDEVDALAHIHERYARPTCVFSTLLV